MAEDTFGKSIVAVIGAGVMGAQIAAHFVNQRREGGDERRVLEVRAIQLVQLHQVAHPEWRVYGVNIVLGNVEMLDQDLANSCGH